MLAGSRAQPVTQEQATPAIEQFLLNERKRKIIAKDMKAMRDAAKIEYVGKFAEGAASAARSARLRRPRSRTGPGACTAHRAGSDPTSISKGMGLK